MSAMSPTSLALLCIPLLLAVWLVICRTISTVGGWRALGKCYQSRVSTPAPRIWFASIALGRGFGSATYRGCLVVHFDNDGISLSVLPLYRFSHPNLFVPWKDVTECRRERLHRMNVTTVSLAAFPVPILFLGRAGRALDERWQRIKSMAEPAVNAYEPRVS